MAVTVTFARHPLNDGPTVERLARMIAVANNGGEWASHYTAEQKDVWRERAKAAIRLIFDEN